MRTTLHGSGRHEEEVKEREREREEREREEREREREICGGTKRGHGENETERELRQAIRTVLEVEPVRTTLHGSGRHEKR